MKPSLEADKLYNAQAFNWARKEPVCLSDFTARPEILNICQPLQNASVLDLGCGDGYVSRLLAKAGARKVVGIDISEGMVNAGIAEEEKEPLGIKYYAADASSTIPVLLQNLEPVQYDIVICVFLFNYISIDEMVKVMKAARQLLVPKTGKFIFSVPHPCFPFWNRGGKALYPFYFDLANQASANYFGQRNETFQGKIWRKDGKELHVQLVHKTFDDYFKALEQAGFNAQLPRVVELHADEKLQERMPEFVGNLKGIPLHVAFSVALSSPPSKCIPQSAEQKVWKSTPSIEEYQIQISSQVQNALEVMFGRLSTTFDSETVVFYNEKKEQVDRPTGEIDLYNADGILFATRVEIEIVRQVSLTMLRYLETVSVCKITGLKLGSDLFGRFAYYLISWCAGKFMTKRGKLYDVINRELDVKQEDVLFSATNAGMFC